MLLLQCRERKKIWSSGVASKTGCCPIISKGAKRLPRSISGLIDYSLVCCPINNVGLNRFAVSGKSIFGDLALTNRFGTASRVGSMCGIA